ncbi:hypothetical protein [Diaphorobacter aerolatus]|uniref:Uncharacterized protein n=1 Tax=Diaphorobacter aerolatus TaxID=1288495 RepID=A0A7H0GKP6_9BURK|nr:hypothetical protein [Diaphorobacter aerolatus]QNP48862.1 hypothetical protein H9K75_01210 [Diaphorobacter aerolatus]
MQMKQRGLQWWLAFRGLLGLLVLGALMGHSVAQAQNVLLLHTTEPGAAAAFANMKKEFEGAGATVTEQAGLDLANSVSPATFTTAGGGKYDIVIMTSAYSLVDASNWAPINDAIKTRLANAFIMFNDGCCQGPTFPRWRKALVPPEPSHPHWVLFRHPGHSRRNSTPVRHTALPSLA